MTTFKFVALLVLFSLVCGCGVRPMPPTTSSSPTTSRRVPSSIQTKSPAVEAVDTAQPSSEISALAKTIMEGASNDRDRAYRLYRWLSENITYDVEALSAAEIPAQDADTVLEKRNAVCAGYANLFQAMAVAVGLESQVVPGRSPDRGLELSGRFRADESNHAWNAVKIDGRWKLLDSTWGAGYLDETKRFVSRPNDDWFLVEPETFIYSHFPEDPKWQLLDEELSREEFDHLPTLTPGFFSKGLQLLEPTVQPIASAGESVFRVRTDRGYFVTGLVERRGAKLSENFVLAQQAQGEVEIRVRFPEAGEYDVHIMARGPDEKTFVGVGTLVVNSNGGTDSPFPRTYGTFSEKEIQIVAGAENRLRSGTPVLLRYRAPEATALYLRAGEEQSTFEQSGDIFTLEFTPKVGEVKVFAHFPGEEKLWAILAYDVE